MLADGAIAAACRCAILLDARNGIAQLPEPRAANRVDYAARRPTRYKALPRFLKGQVRELCTTIRGNWAAWPWDKLKWISTGDPSINDMIRTLQLPIWP